MALSDKAPLLLFALLLFPGDESVTDAGLEGIEELPVIQAVDEVPPIITGIVMVWFASVFAVLVHMAERVEFSEAPPTNIPHASLSPAQQNSDLRQNSVAPQQILPQQDSLDVQQAFPQQ